MSKAAVNRTDVNRAEAAQAERARRELARRNFTAFCEYVTPWYHAARHHQFVAKYLEQVLLYIETDGKEGIGRLMVNEPPRHGKSLQISRLFPSFLLGKLPDKRVILTAYGADLAQEDSGAVRAFVTSPRYQNLFGERSTMDTPVDVSDSTRSKAAWDLAEPYRGGVIAAGVGGGIVGKGAHLLVVDDPFKNRKDAESKAYRDIVKSWWQSAAYTRLEAGGAVIITHTRWHPDDLAGTLLKAMMVDPMADQWTVLTLPAVALEAENYAQDEKDQRKKLAEGQWLDLVDPMGRLPGEALWPEKYPVEALKRIKANVSLTDVREWDAQYQQLPKALGGNFFQAGWFDIIPSAPEGLLWFRFWDLALTESKQADYTCGGAVAMDRHGDVFIRDMVRDRLTWPDAKERIAALSAVEGSNVVYGVEGTAFQLAALQELIADRRMANRTIIGIWPHQDKVLRALPMQARASLGKVHLIAGMWVSDFIEEALGFPTASHDDQVDSAVGGLQLIGEYEAILEQMAGQGTLVYDDRVAISDY